MLRTITLSAFLLASCTPCHCPEPERGTGGASASSTTTATSLASTGELDAGHDEPRECVEPVQRETCSQVGDCWPGNSCMAWGCVAGRCVYSIQQGAGCNAGPGYWHCEEGACCPD